MTSGSESRPGDPVTPVAILSPVRVVAELLGEELGRDEGLSVIATETMPSRLRPVLAQRRDVVLLVDGAARELPEMLAEVLRSFDPVAVLVFGLEADARTLHRSLDAGVRGALGPEATLADLVRAIRVVAVGEVYLSASIGALLGQRKTGVGWHPALTPREEEVAEHIAKGESNAEIARELRLSRNTVKIHVRNVLSKLGLTSRREIDETPRE